MIEDHMPTNSPEDLERVVDKMEERVLGRTMDQIRDEDEDSSQPAIEQDLGDESPETGPAAEPSS